MGATVFVQPLDLVKNRMQMSGELLWFPHHFLFIWFVSTVSGTLVCFNIGIFFLSSGVRGLFHKKIGLGDIQNLRLVLS